MAAGVAALGALAAKGGGLAKAGWTAMSGLEKLILLLWGGDLAAKGLGGVTGLNPYSTEKARVGLGSKQIEMQAALGRKEEARADKLISRLMAEQEKQYLRSEKTQTTRDIRTTQADQLRMTMAMIMSLANIQEQQGQLASKPPPSTASMLSLMR